MQALWLFVQTFILIFATTISGETIATTPTTNDTGQGYTEEYSETSETTENDIRHFITNHVEDIDPQFIPVSDHSEPLDLFVDFALLSLTNFDEISGEVDMVASLNLTWVGSNLPKWDPELLNGKDTFALDVSKIWTPRLLLLNPSRAVSDLARFSDRARITHNRTVIWNVISGIQASCSVDVANFPFDQQECSINIAIWGYDTREIHIIGQMEKLTESFVENSGWSLDSVTVEGVNSGSFPYLKITLFTTRRYEYFLINILLPPVLLSMLSPSVFLLPAASGERVSYSVTCFLAFGVFMNLLSDNMPKSSVPIAHLSFFLMYMLIQSCAVTFCTIVSLRIYGKMDTMEEVPRWLQIFVSIIRLKPCRNGCRTTKKKVVSPEMTPVKKLTIPEIADPVEYDECKRRYLTASARASLSREPNVTWYTVGRTLDAFFFTVFLGWMLFTTITSLMSLRLI